MSDGISRAQYAELLNLIYMARAAASRGGGGALTFSFVYQPGGVASENVFTTWAALSAAANAVPGLKFVFLDPTFAPCTVPAGAWSMKGWLVYAALVLGGETALTFENGATLTTLWNDAFYVQMTNASNAPVRSLQTGELVFLDVGASIVSTGGAPFFLLASPNQAAFLMEVGTSLGDGNEAVLEVQAGAECIILLAGYGAQVNGSALVGAGDVASEVDLCAIFSTDQPGFLGALDLTTNVALEQDGNQASGSNAAQPSYSFLNDPTLGFFQAGGLLGQAGGVTVTTANAAPQTVATSYAPQPNVTARVTGAWNAQDGPNHRTYGAESTCNLRNFGAVVVAGEEQHGASGDAALVGATVTFSIVGGLLNVVFTPPGGYVGEIFWRAFLEVVENEGP